MPEKKDKAYPSQFDKVKEITDKLEAGRSPNSTIIP